MKLTRTALGASLALVVALIGGGCTSNTPAPSESAAPSAPPSSAPSASGTAGPKVAGTGDLHIAVVSDSYSAGSSMNTSADTLWVATAAEALDATIQNLSVSGTGYLTGDGYGVPDTFVTRAAKIEPDTVETIFFGSRNDLGRDRSDVSDAAAKAFAAAKKAAPSTVIVVVGPPWVDGDPGDSILNYRNTLRAAAADAGLAFYDPIAERWFFDEPQLIGKDTVHPTDAGHQYLAKQLIPIIELNLPTE